MYLLATYEQFLCNKGLQNRQWCNTLAMDNNKESGINNE